MISTIYDPPSFPKPVPLSQPLYHYTNQLGLLGIVENEELWATKIQYMNDSTEFSAIFNMVANRLDSEEHKTPTIPPPSLEGSVTADALRAVCDLDLPWSLPIPSRSMMLRAFAAASSAANVCVVSLCTNGDLLSQWRGYARGDYGYSIGFNAHKLVDFSEKGNFVLRPCVYDTELQNRIVDEICKYYLASTIVNELAIIQQFTATVISYGAFFKDPSSSQEDEWRLVSRPLADRELYFRKGKSMIIPYGKKMEFHGSSANTPIDDVVVGPCPHMDLSVEAVTTLLHGKQPTLSGGVKPVVRPSAIPYRDW
jgi:Protein of unknown function (DUF2971)